MADRIGYCCPHCEEAFVDEGELVEHASVCQFDIDTQLEHHGLPLDIAAPLPLGVDHG